MKCPKCKAINLAGAKECKDCGVIFADVRGLRQQETNLCCPWNDHGHVCGARGSMSDTANGQGPWYCSEHYWRLKGSPIDHSAPTPKSYRERWYAERGLPYEASPIRDFPPFKCVGREIETIQRRAREPGDDDEAAYE